jgi:hypothetical protein
MTDTSPEALDALEKRLRIRGAQPHERANHYVRRMEFERHEAADTIAALRASPVAVPEVPDALISARRDLEMTATITGLDFPATLAKIETALAHLKGDTP